MKNPFSYLFKKTTYKYAPLLTNRWANEAGANTVPRPTCDCFAPLFKDRSRYQIESCPNWQELRLHTEAQNKSLKSYRRLQELIEIAVKDGREVFSPGPEMPPAQWAQITVLPKSIAKLKNVKHLNLYGSSLVRIPPEIGEMESLEEFTPYTSYRLHWFPYEISRCLQLRRSTVSTRALYGNYKYRPPFPRLPQINPEFTPSCCSVCRGPFGDQQPKQFWISLPVATDVLPLLVHACSDQCLAKLPSPASETYIQGPHQGGLGLAQPKRL